MQEAYHSAGGVDHIGGLSGEYKGYPGIGYHYASWNEKGASAGTCEFIGDNNADSSQAGLTAAIWG